MKHFSRQSLLKLQVRSAFGSGYGLTLLPTGRLFFGRNVLFSLQVAQASQNKAAERAARRNKLQTLSDGLHHWKSPCQQSTSASVFKESEWQCLTCRGQKAPPLRLDGAVWFTSALSHPQTGDFAARLVNNQDPALQGCSVQRCAEPKETAVRCLAQSLAWLEAKRWLSDDDLTLVPIRGGSSA